MAEVGGTTIRPITATMVTADPARTGTTWCLSHAGGSISFERTPFTNAPMAPLRKGFSTKRYENAAQANTTATCTRYIHNGVSPVKLRGFMSRNSG